MKGNIHIEDSYQVRKRDFDSVLDMRFEIAREKDNQSEMVVFENRKRFSLKMEWTVHNFLYAIHIKRERTKDVDLNYPCDKPEIIYKIFGVLVWIFIK